MSLQSEIEKKIEKKNQEIAGLEAQIRESKAFVQGLQEALRSVQRDSGLGRTVSMPRAKQFRDGSDMAKARDYILSIGKPAPIADLLIGIGKEPTQKNIKSVAGALNNYAREGRVFVRTAPNTFFLLELQPKGLALELPDDFGIDDDQEEERAS